MTNNPALDAFASRDDLKQYGSVAIGLFSLQLKFSLPDIRFICDNSIVDGFGDKKVDMIYIDEESGIAVIAQTYLPTTQRESAPANKASDLNTAMVWLLGRPIDEVPSTIKTHAGELRRAINENKIRTLYIWYVHPLPESINVGEELKSVEHGTKAIVSSNFSGRNIEIHAEEVGERTLGEWYQLISTPIFVTSPLKIIVKGGIELKDADWSTYVTSIPANLLFDLFKQHGTKLFSANVRDYLGSREQDKNINNGIKTTARDDPSHFLVYNNGITALVNDYKFFENDAGDIELELSGISIVNGAQTTGAIGSLEARPENNIFVQIRLIKCKNIGTVQNIVRYNNSQNKISASDFRSGDPVQTRLSREFESLGKITYLHRRGSGEDVIKRTSGMPSYVAGQAIAAFHIEPDVSYHQKTNMWEDDTLYSRYFNELTTAEHITFAYSLILAIEELKKTLSAKEKKNEITEVEKDQLQFFRERGSIFLTAAATSGCLEIILGNPIPNKFRLKFKDNPSLDAAVLLWQPILGAIAPFVENLTMALSDGVRNKQKIHEAIKKFQSLVAATQSVNKTVFDPFKNQLLY